MPLSPSLQTLTPMKEHCQFPSEHNKDLSLIEAKPKATLLSRLLACAKLPSPQPWSLPMVRRANVGWGWHSRPKEGGILFCNFQHHRPSTLKRAGCRKHVIAFTCTFRLASAGKTAILRVGKTWLVTHSTQKKHAYGRWLWRHNVLTLSATVKRVSERPWGVLKKSFLFLWFSVLTLQEENTKDLE